MQAFLAYTDLNKEIAGWKENIPVLLWLDVEREYKILKRYPDEMDRGLYFFYRTFFFLKMINIPNRN